MYKNSLDIIVWQRFCYSPAVLYPHAVAVTLFQTDVPPILKYKDETLVPLFLIYREAVEGVFDGAPAPAANAIPDVDGFISDIDRIAATIASISLSNPCETFPLSGRFLSPTVDCDIFLLL
jgi:hypothetical protein